MLRIMLATPYFEASVQKGFKPKPLPTSAKYCYLALIVGASFKPARDVDCDIVAAMWLKIKEKNENRQRLQMDRLEFIAV